MGFGGLGEGVLDGAAGMECMSVRRVARIDHWETPVTPRKGHAGR